MRGFVPRLRVALPPLVLAGCVATPPSPSDLIGIWSGRSESWSENFGGLASGELCSVTVHEREYRRDGTYSSAWVRTLEPSAPRECEDEAADSEQTGTWLMPEATQAPALVRHIPDLIGEGSIRLPEFDVEVWMGRDADGRFMLLGGDVWRRE